jgi:zinc D-Ala-D-Ala carboxypeptidase
MKISKHVSYNEGIRSSTASRMGMDNDPNATQLLNMSLLSEEIFEPLREYVGGPIRINSFFRSKELNKAVGGAHKFIDGAYVATSQHCKGEAFDLDDSYGHKTNAEMYEFIKDNLSYDQLIWEFGSDENPSWLHVSYVSEEENRNVRLKAYKESGKTKYKSI